MHKKFVKLKKKGNAAACKKFQNKKLISNAACE